MRTKRAKWARPRLTRKLPPGLKDPPMTVVRRVGKGGPVQEVREMLALARAWCDATGESRSALSLYLFNQGNRLDEYEARPESLTVGRAEWSIAWLVYNWPVGEEWPRGVRPWCDPLLDARPITPPAPCARSFSRDKGEEGRATKAQQPP